MYKWTLWGALLPLLAGVALVVVGLLLPGMIGILFLVLGLIGLGSGTLIVLADRERSVH